MIISYKNVDLDIFVNNSIYEYDINENIEVMRGKFNDAIARLSQKHNSLDYWLMRISERNTLVNNFFLDICRIELIENLLKIEKNIVVNTNNIAIFKHFNKRNSVIIKRSALFRCKVLAGRYKPYLSLLKYLVNNLFSAFSFKRLNANKDKINNTIIIQTWVSDNNISKGTFKDSYFHHLAEHLRDSGHKVLIWPIIYSSNKRNQLSNFFRKDKQFIQMDDYLTLSDYARGVLHFIKKRQMDLSLFTIGEIDYGKVVNCYQNQETLELSYFIYCFSKRIALLGNDKLTFMVNHENMIPEKALILGVREYLPKSKVIGYFHTVMPKNILCLDYANQDEFQLAPKPHRILFNSHLYQALFQLKYPSLDTDNAVALKQLHLKGSISTSIEQKKQDKLVLIVFSGTIDDVILMIDLLNNSKVDCHYLFRMHPMNTFVVSDYYKHLNYSLVNEENLQTLLGRTNKVISTYSALAVEAALSGHMVGLVYNKRKLLLNPFDHTVTKNYRLISNSTALNRFLVTSYEQQATTSIFNLDEHYYSVFEKL